MIYDENIVRIEILRVIHELTSLRKLFVLGFFRIQIKEINLWKEEIFYFRKIAHIQTKNTHSLIQILVIYNFMRNIYFLIFINFYTKIIQTNKQKKLLIYIEIHVHVYRFHFLFKM